jgi:hypothetical protein
MLRLEVLDTEWVQQENFEYKEVPAKRVVIH